MNSATKVLIGLGTLGVVSAASYGLGSSSEAPIAPVVAPVTVQVQESTTTPEVKESEPVKNVPETTTTKTPTKKVEEQPKPVVQKTEVKAEKCNPNYSGCLKPDASDYDCSGGSGNGPYYTGKVQVIGVDQYDLDRDGNGWGCE